MFSYLWKWSLETEHKSQSSLCKRDEDQHARVNVEDVLLLCNVH